MLNAYSPVVLLYEMLICCKCIVSENGTGNQTVLNKWDISSQKKQILYQRIDSTNEDVLISAFVQTESQVQISKALV